MRILIKFAFCLVVLSFSVIVLGAPSNELTTFVNNSIKQLNESTLKIPYFEKAEVDEVQTISTINGNDLYLCWLKNKEGRVGYIAVAESSGSFNIIAFSATTAEPDYFLKNLKINGLPKKQLNLSTAKQVSFIENVPLVATAKTTIGTDPIEISEIAASLSSILNYIQNENKILFFGYNGSGGDPQYVIRSERNSANTRRPDNPDWKSFTEEAKEAIERENIPKGQTPEQKTESRVQQRKIIKPIIRRRLLNPDNSRERLQVLANEDSFIVNLTKTQVSSGMKNAILLQQDYLDGNISNLKENIELFLRTRGRTVKIDTIPFEKIQLDSLPAILIGPDNVAGILLGFIDIDNERFASVFLPNTGSPIIMTRTEKTRQIHLEAGLPAEPNLEEDEEYQRILKLAKEAEIARRKLFEEKGLPDPKPKSVEQRIHEGLEKAKATEDNTIIAEDKKSELPKGFENGIHIINCSFFSSWQVLSISNIQIGDNW
ncbi:MAG: hypothetical protein JW787_10245 [Sedimentisphaerales bacterium]|nr:hypothetical protein [Sedimentisphaerales bacterium]